MRSRRERRTLRRQGRTRRLGNVTGRSARPRVKIYAERNSGSNFLHALIERNLDADIVPGVPEPTEIRRSVDQRWAERIGDDAFRRVLVRRVDRFHARELPRTLGWKHSLPLVDRLGELASIGTVFVTLTKNPYSWLLSLHRNPYQPVEPLEFDEFVAMPWYPLPRDNLTTSQTTPTGLWNLKNAAYLRLREVVVAVNLRYEDLVVDPESVLARIADELDLTWVTRAFENVDESTKTIGKRYADYRQYYADEHWRSELSPRSVERINAQLDTDVVEAFGYEVIEPDALG